MTHYMELLAANQPWNLILFMAVPVVLAETVAICEVLALAADLKEDSALCRIRRAAAWAAALWMAGVAAHLVPSAAVPLTLSGGWRGPFDIIAVACYLLTVFPLAAIAWPRRNPDSRQSKISRAAALSAFLVLAHVAMVFGMLDPSLTGSVPASHAPASAMPHSGH